MRGPGLQGDPSLADMRRAFVHALVFHCRRCSHRATVPLDDLIDRFGLRLRESDIVQRGYCSQCSSRTFELSPMAAWHKQYVNRR